MFNQLARLRGCHRALPNALRKCAHSLDRKRRGERGGPEMLEQEGMDERELSRAFPHLDLEGIMGPTAAAPVGARAALGRGLAPRTHTRATGRGRGALTAPRVKPRGSLLRLRFCI